MKAELWFSIVVIAVGFEGCSRLWYCVTNRREGGIEGEMEGEVEREKGGEVHAN